MIDDDPNADLMAWDADKDARIADLTRHLRAALVYIAADNKFPASGVRDNGERLLSANAIAIDGSVERFNFEAARAAIASVEGKTNE